MYTRDVGSEKRTGTLASPLLWSEMGWSRRRHCTVLSSIQTGCWIRSKWEARWGELGGGSAGQGTCIAHHRLAARGWHRDGVPQRVWIPKKKGYTSLTENNWLAQICSDPHKAIGPISPLVGEKNIHLTNLCFPVIQCLIIEYRNSDGF